MWCWRVISNISARVWKDQQQTDCFHIQLKLKIVVVNEFQKTDPNGTRHFEHSFKTKWNLQLRLKIELAVVIVVDFGGHQMSKYSAEVEIYSGQWTNWTVAYVLRKFWNADQYYVEKGENAGIYIDKSTLFIYPLNFHYTKIDGIHRKINENWMIHTSVLWAGSTAVLRQISLAEEQLVNSGNCFVELKEIRRS